MDEVDDAAGRLFRSIKAPTGVLNAFAFVDGSELYIRILVDKEYLPILEQIPTTFDGYRVIIEARELGTSNVNCSLMVSHLPIFTAFSA